MTSKTLAENFALYFDIKFANTKALQQEAYRIRHAVYCEELGWEPLRDDKMEIDNCDSYSFTLLLQHKATKRYAGTARLVITPPNQPECLLPFEAHCLDSITPGAINLQDFQPGSYSEISRLAVPEEFRRRLGEQHTPFVVNEFSSDVAVFSEEERRNFPNIAVGLYLSIIALSRMCHHQAMFVVVEPRLKKRLERIGFPFEQLGEEMDYHGVRALFYLRKENYTAKLSPEVLELYQFLYDSLYPQVLLLPYLQR
ncbi:PEP-CTERM/exosortase system-associated acyltransferase [Arsukibacterium sp.]|uniref:PEP-CTERM/exosortase system-associated acyltransferase n=1 Tax=Arsukibacterium sp. TaxID=1977258 RepID=UPI002FD9E2F4